MRVVEQPNRPGFVSIPDKKHDGVSHENAVLGDESHGDRHSVVEWVRVFD